jgi:hypothetical protein
LQEAEQLAAAALRASMDGQTSLPHRCTPCEQMRWAVRNRSLAPAQARGCCVVVSWLLHQF